MKLGKLFKKKNIIVVGASGHAKVIIEAIELGKKYNIIGLIDTYKEIGTEVLGYKVIGREEDIPKLASTYKLAGGVIAIGDNWTRYLIFKKIKSIYPDFNFLLVVHPTAQVSESAQIGEGTLIESGAVVKANADIGINCIVNSNTSIGHDSSMGDFSSAAPGVSVGGNTKIGDFSAVSIGATIIHGISIGTNSVIGAGSVVVKDIPAYVVVYGVPAKVVKSRKAEDKYL